MFNSLYLVQPIHIKMHQQEIPFTSLNVLEFFCVPLYTDCSSNHHKKFQETSTYNVNVEH